jgi:putative ABC transport system ATP-binding protein
MNILGCLDTPTDGTYQFMGVDVGKLTRDQRALLLPNYLGFVFKGSISSTAHRRWRTSSCR